MGVMHAVGDVGLTVLKSPWYLGESIAGAGRGVYKGARDGVKGTGYLMTHNGLDSINGFLNYGGNLVYKVGHDSVNGTKALVSQHPTDSISKFFRYVGSGFQSDADKTNNAKREKTEASEETTGHGGGVMEKSMDKIGGGLTNGLKAASDLARSADPYSNGTMTNSRGRNTAPTVDKYTNDSKQVNQQAQLTTTNQQTNTQSAPDVGV